MKEKVLGEDKNRRKVPRQYLVFYLRVFDWLTGKVLGHLVNISPEGVMLLSDSAIPVNEVYRLRMQLPSEVSEVGEIVFNAESRWCKPDGNPDFYVTGFQIQDLKEEQKNDILKLIDDFSFVVS